LEINDVWYLLTLLPLFGTFDGRRLRLLLRERRDAECRRVLDLVLGTGAPYGIERYPENDRGEACHDVHIRTNEYTTNVGVEVVTSSKNLDHLISKWKRYQNRDRLTLWLFDRRETACRLWNKLDAQGDFYLDGRFSDYGNWSAKATNRKIWRSSKEFRGKPAGDLVQTVTGLLEGRIDTIQELFEDYHSRN
jgi:hypothetical protein